MLELPESYTLARQIGHVLAGKTVSRVTPAASPHKFAWYHGDPEGYPELLEGQAVDTADSIGGMVRIGLGPCRLLFADGVSLKYHEAGAKLPAKHQLLLEFGDGSALTASVQMYGGLWCFSEGTFHNPYYLVAMEKPSPLTEAFDEAYFERLLQVVGAQKVSAKAFLATEQRIPGLGNGVLQDILYHARIHPKKKIGSLCDKQRSDLYRSVKETLARMAESGGRDTETDLFGQRGGYATCMSKHTVDEPCPSCGGTVVKEAYMGGSVYYCGQCQEL